MPFRTRCRPQTLFERVSACWFEIIVLASCRCHTSAAGGGRAIFFVGLLWLKVSGKSQEFVMRNSRRNQAPVKVFQAAFAIVSAEGFSDRNGKMFNTNRLFFLRIALVVTGLTFIFGVYTFAILWPSGSTWGQENSHYLMMIIGLYASLGVFLLIASRDPVAHKSLIWFTIWSSVVHGAIMRRPGHQRSSRARPFSRRCACAPSRRDHPCGFDAAHRDKRSCCWISTSTKQDLITPRYPSGKGRDKIRVRGSAFRPI